MPRAHSSFNLITLCDKVRVADSAVAFLKEQGILKTSVLCKKCGCDLSTVKKRHGTGYYYFRCCSCDSMISIRYFFYKYLQYLWRDFYISQYQIFIFRIFCILFFCRDGTILAHRHIGIRTFILLTYSFAMCQGLTLQQKIHEVCLHLIDVTNISIFWLNILNIF